MAGGDRTAKPAMGEDPGMPRTRPRACNVGTFARKIINPDPDLGGILGLGTELMAARDIAPWLRCWGPLRSLDGRVHCDRRT
jgi:hypothetical protein